VSRSVLVVDDDDAIRETLVEFFVARGDSARGAASAAAAQAAVAAHAPDVVVLDLRLPDGDGIALAEALRRIDTELAVVLLTGHADVPTAVRAMRDGAADVLEKPVDLTALGTAVDRAAETGRLAREVRLLRAQGRVAPGSDDPTVDRLVALAARHPDAPVLITGETGTGKGYIARRIHDASARSALPFVAINAASLSPTFFESELFGHERGAFTDARQAKRGLFEVAGRGTAFLDEIGELALEVQPKLLTAIEDRAFRRLGGTAELRVEARLICATNVALADAVEAKRFRADLYYRLQVLTIALPPLRERPHEIARLADALLPRGARLTAAARDALGAYAWPGNVRELKNTLWRAAILADGRAIDAPDLGLAPPGAGRGGPLTLVEAERRAIAAALAETGGNRTKAAALLGIARSTLTSRLKTLGLD
jgi:two-component system response regulator HydG